MNLKKKKALRADEEEALLVLFPLVGNMDAKETSYCTVLDKESQSKFLLYTQRKNGRLHVCVTDVASVWSTEYTEETLKLSMCALKSTEDYVLKLRSACGRGDVSVVVSDTGVKLHAGAELSVTLSRLEDLQATAELKELLFRMADSLNQCAFPSVSPLKNHQRRPLEFEPRQQQSCAPSVTVKKRPVGVSLINPGTKKKAKATGVAFDDADQD